MTDKRQEFNTRIQGLDINVARGDDGLYTVYTTREPLFCFDGHDKDELEKLVSFTIGSYAKIFFGVEGLDVETQDQPLPVPPVPVERPKVESRLRPVFNLAA